VVERAVPADAAATIGAVASVRDKPASDTVCAGFYFGEHSSVLAAMMNGRLCFVRTLGLGVDALVDALTRPIRVRQGPEGFRPRVTLERGAARDLLLAMGVPGPDVVVDPQRGIDGSAVLPLLQPVVQRICIEVKQSLRFGMEEAAGKAPVRLTIVGPGGS